jgi:hypothetical protein
MKRAVSMVAALVLAGCASDQARPTHIRAPLVAIPTGTAGLGGVLGASAANLTALFGPPTADVREGTARKLQFGNATCVLDAYLYPKSPKPDGAEPVVTYLDARQTDGSPIDRASCVGALEVARRR